MALLVVGRGSVSSLMKFKSSEGLAGTGGYTSKMVRMAGQLVQAVGTKPQFFLWTTP